MQNAIRIIHDEHRSISAVLHGLKELARLAQDVTVRPRFDALRAMIRYIDEYPERLHHPKEDRHLFAAVEQRAPEARPLIARLKREHEEGARLVRELERRLVFFEEGWPEGAREFLAAVDAYAQFHWDHMRCEEKELLPLAGKVLGPADWASIDAAFAGNDDPIADLREQDFRELFTRIVSLAPAPIGLGDPWEKRKSA